MFVDMNATVDLVARWQGVEYLINVMVLSRRFRSAIGMLGSVGGNGLEICLQFVHLIGAFPSEFRVIAAEMAVNGCFSVYWPA